VALVLVVRQPKAIVVEQLVMDLLAVVLDTRSQVAAAALVAQGRVV
jgi:hypothetical protein